MSWSAALYQTYENLSRAPVIDREHANATPLPPLFHDVKKIDFELGVNADGNLIAGSAIRLGDKKNPIECIVPTDEESESRTSTKVAPAPLFDKLPYMAGDYDNFTSGKERNKQYEAYISRLRLWRDSGHWDERLNAILSYLERGTLISDLAAAGLLTTGEDGKIDESELGGRARIYVNLGWGERYLPWESERTWESHIAFTLSRPRERGLCYISGKELPLTSSHQKIIGNAKLISSNQDVNGFIVNDGFLGGAENALSVGYESSEKVHLALKWLIRRQGFYVGDSLWLAFGTRTTDVPGVQTDSYGIICEKGGGAAPSRSADVDESADADESADIAGVFAARLRSSIWGRYNKSASADNVIILGASCETPGRMSLTYYSELGEDRYLQNIEDWHSGCSWLITNRRAENPDGGKPLDIDYYGSPSLPDIVEIYCGVGAPDKLKKATFARLVPCVVEKRKIPSDIMRGLARQGASRPAFDSDRAYRRARSIACAVIKKYYNDLEGREVYKMTLDKECNDRSYLFGRWLACAHNVEEFARYYSGDSPRMTNAESLMRQFSLHPRKTCEIINNQLTYYFKKIYGRPSAGIIKDEMYEIIHRLGPDGYTNARLSELYLLGYASQLHYIKNTVDEINKTKERNGDAK